MEDETKRFWCYVLSSCLFVVSLITCSLPWSHWAYTINYCPGFNCECVLFGTSYTDQFSGGNAVYCQLITFLQIPLFLTAGFLSFYQGRRALNLRKQKRAIKLGNLERKNQPVLILKSRNGLSLKEGDIIIEQQVIEMEPPSYKACIALIVTCSISLVVLLSVYILLTVGYHYSCNEYRKMLVKLLRASGNMAQILSERLECTAIFSFMDYLQPKRRMYDPYDYGRKNKINTGLSLYVAQLVLLANTFVWIYITFFNVKFLKSRLNLNKGSDVVDRSRKNKRRNYKR